jgi:hypothetical protein
MSLRPDSPEREWSIISYRGIKNIQPADGALGMI